MTLTAELLGPAPGVQGRPRPHHRPMPHRRPTPMGRPMPYPHAARTRAPLPGPLRAPRRRVLERTWVWTAVLVLIAAASFGMHAWRADTSSDLFVDESFYTQVGQSIAEGGMPWATGSYFFLHPPGFFVLEGGWMRLFGIHPYEVWPQVNSIRVLVGLIAALSAPLIALIVAKLAGRGPAVVAAVLFVANAFVNRQTGLVILEPATLFWALAGYTIFAYLSPAGTRRRPWQIAAAGLAFGFCNITKEFGVFVTVLPLLAALVFRIWLTRREAFGALLLASLPWAAWVALVVQTGHWHEFVQQITSGFHRTTGQEQISGFNREGAPTFLSAILSNLDVLWTAYTVLGLGSLAICWLVLRRRTPARTKFVALFGAGAIPLLGYSVTLGTNEEQFFNFLFYPALICLTVVVATNWGRIRTALKAAVIALTVVAVLSDAVQYVRTHLTRSNGTYAVDYWMAAHARPGTVVEVTNPVQRQVFLRYQMVDAAPGRPLDPKAQYYVVFYSQVDKGYAFVDRDTVDKNVKGLRIAFQTSNSANGRMVIYARH